MFVAEASKFIGLVTVNVTGTFNTGFSAPGTIIATCPAQGLSAAVRPAALIPTLTVFPLTFVEIQFPPQVEVEAVAVIAEPLGAPLMVTVWFATVPP